MAFTKSNELQTRIMLKYDSYANWTTNNPVLLAGEVAIATIPSGTSVPTKTNREMQDLPNVVMKVGDGSTHYNDLKFVSALAADVYDWAKASEKPSYDASEILNLKEFVENISDIDTNTQYTIVEVENSEGFKFELKYKDLADTEFKSFNTPVYIDLTGANARLKAAEEKLDKLIGEGEGFYACNGQIVPIKWSRDSVNDPFTYTLTDGTPLVMGVGKTYVAVIGTSGAAGVSYE
jgi:hypothetical protein